MANRSKPRIPNPTPDTVAIRRGGYRAGHHNPHPTPPVYERCRVLPDDPNRRTRRWRWDFHRAVHAAVEAGELTRHAAHLALTMADTWSDARGREVWPARATIGEACGGWSPVTVGTHMAELRRHGWVHVVHRYRVMADHVEGHSNLYRLVIPTRWYRHPNHTRQNPAGSTQPARRTNHTPVVAEDDDAATSGDMAAAMADAMHRVRALAERDRADLVARLPVVLRARPGRLQDAALAELLLTTHPPP